MDKLKSLSINKVMFILIMFILIVTVILMNIPGKGIRNLRKWMKSRMRVVMMTLRKNYTTDLREALFYF